MPTTPCHPDCEMRRLFIQLFRASFWDLFVAWRSARIESQFMVGDSISAMIAAKASTEGETRRFTIALQP
jgi:hypothetical protein